MREQAFEALPMIGNDTCHWFQSGRISKQYYWVEREVGQTIQTIQAKEIPKLAKTSSKNRSVRLPPNVIRGMGEMSGENGSDWCDPQYSNRHTLAVGAENVPCIMNTRDGDGGKPGQTPL